MPPVVKRSFLGEMGRDSGVGGPMRPTLGRVDRQVIPRPKVRRLTNEPVPDPPGPGDGPFQSIGYFTLGSTSVTNLTATPIDFGTFVDTSDGSGYAGPYVMEVSIAGSVSGTPTGPGICLAGDAPTGGVPGIVTSAGSVKAHGMFVGTIGAPSTFYLDVPGSVTAATVTGTCTVYSTFATYGDA